MAEVTYFALHNTGDFDTISPRSSSKSPDSYRDSHLLRTSDFQLSTSHFRLRTSNFGLQKTTKYTKLHSVYFRYSFAILLFLTTTKYAEFHRVFLQLRTTNLTSILKNFGLLSSDFQLPTHFYLFPFTFF